MGMALPQQRWRRTLLVLALVLSALIVALNLLRINGFVYGSAVSYLDGMDVTAWGSLGHTLALIVGLPAWGKLSDLYGRRSPWLAALAVVMIGAAVAGTSQAMEQLILGRIVQGLGSGGLVAVAPALIADLFPPSTRAKWQGAWTALFGLLVALLLGVSFNVLSWMQDWWRGEFFTFLWLGGFAVLAAWFGLPASRADARPTVDIAGVCAATGAMTLLLLAIGWSGGFFPWGSAQNVGLLLGAAAAIGALVIVERRAADPVIDLGFLKNRIYVVALVLMFLLGATRLGFGPLIWPFFQGSGTAFFTGPVTAPLVLAAVVSAVLAGLIMSRTGRYKLLLLVLFAVGTGGAVLLTLMDASTTEIDRARNMAITGLGFGGLSVVLLVVAQNALPGRNLGAATAGLLVAGWLGASIGSRLGRIPAFGDLGPDPEAFGQQIQRSLPFIADLWGSQIGVMVVVLAAGFFVAMLLPEIPLRGRQEDDTAVAETEPPATPSP